MRSLHLRSFLFARTSARASALVLACVAPACNDGDVATTAGKDTGDSNTDSSADGIDTRNTETPGDDDRGDHTESADSTGGSMDASATGDTSGDTTMGGGPASGMTNDGTASNGSNDATDSDSDTESDSDTDGGNGPGPIPAEYPGVDVGLCAPPGMIEYCYTGAPPTYNVGECGPGTQQCIALDLDFGEWSACEGESLPAREICDGLDNDCDGQVDEDQGFETCGIGLCMHTVPLCVGGVMQGCDPFQGATPEVCDNIDNDCDGMVDEGLGDDTVFCGVGACYHSVTGCENGMPLDCDPFQGASPETCDNIDNDCDGATDEGLGTITCGCGVCDHTVQACINGNPQTCDPFQGAGPEICDGLDNDCDCLVDENQGNWTCGQDECQVTVPQCIAGVPQPESTCQPIPGGDEICGDGIDNNCDGVAPPCAESFLVGTDTTVRPIDIIWAIDSSSSMAEEIAAVEAGLNSFANTLAASGSSTRLHLLADRGLTDFEMCVAPPLGGPGCTSNPAQGFYHYDTHPNPGVVSFVHSSNALGRIMQQQFYWLPNLQENSHIAFIVTTDDDGDDPLWIAPQDNEPTDDCCIGGNPACAPNLALSFIDDTTTGDACRFQNPINNVQYTSLAFDHAGFFGFASYMQHMFPAYAPDVDWSFYAVIGNTGTTVLQGANDQYEFNNCNTAIEAGDEYVRLAQLTNRLPAMFSICTPAPWPLDSLANDITSGVPNDLYFLQGSPPGQCLSINPATITVVVNGVPMPPADWTYDAASCTLQILNNLPVVGDNVVIVYDNF